MLLTIKWNRTALNQLIRAIDHIQKDSLQHAEKVKIEILTAIADYCITLKNFHQINMS